MKKKYLVLSFILVLGLFAWYYLKSDKSGTLDKDKTAFAIQNTEQIDKIFISSKIKGHVLLEKKDELWYINGKYKASPLLMETFIDETLGKIRVAGPVPAPAKEGVIASMASLASKVEIYANEKLIKVYYVGQPTPDMTGTYMYLEGSEAPFITHIPGFDGFLSTRYPVEEVEWMSKEVFNLKPEEIKSIEVDYPDTPSESFTIRRKNNSLDFDITAAENAKSGQPNYGAVKSYFSAFSNKTCEGFAILSSSATDSILREKPMCALTLVDMKNQVYKLRVFKRPTSRRDHSITDKNGNDLVHDPSRFNAFLNDDPRLMVIQDIVFDPILIKYSDFFLKQSVD